MLLAIDTSSLVLSCALAEEDRLIAEWTVQKRLTHSEQLIPHMDEMIKEAGVSKKDITAVAVSIGPGSFTGLRIGLATAKMLSLKNTSRPLASLAAFTQSSFRISLSA